VGAGWGVACDRVSTRWPEHDVEEGFLPGRAVGWRTVVCALIGGAAIGALPARFGDPALVAFLVAWFAALTLLLATDLDQRLLPDLVTLPLIPIAAIASLSGFNPLVQDAFGLLGAVAIAVLMPLSLYLLSIPFGAGAIGMGDLKLLVSVGLLCGLVRTVVGVLAGAFVAGIVIVVLIVFRRIGLRSYIPFGPFLILGAFWSVLVRFG
jgi:leader peptidase (prepilin peptidase)/N-methyltransferase